MNHAAALADATDAASFSADSKLDRRSLSPSIGRHDSEICLLRSVLFQLDFRQVVLNALNRQPLADDAGGADEHFVLAEAEQLFRLALNGAGVFDALLAGGGVGIAGIDDDGAGLALFQDLAVKDDRSCAELVRGER